jgi:fimbrial isopeptide formation D2 family protein/LPXTG-motif cell wall-anchored protein
MMATCAFSPMSVWAADGDNNITITVTSGHGTAANDRFVAYKILDLTTNLKCTNNESGHTHKKDCYNYAYTVNSQYRAAIIQASQKIATSVGEELENSADDTKILKYLSDLEVKTVDGATVDEPRLFADALYQIIATDTTKALQTGALTSSNGVITASSQGYYLIAETSAGSTDSQADSISNVLLDTKGAIALTVKTKESVPTIAKDVADTGSTTYTETVSARQGDAVTFRLTGTMPTNLDEYDTYQYIFHDTLPTELSFDSTSVAVTIDGTTVGKDSYSVLTTGIRDGETFQVKFADIKKAQDADGKAITVSSSSKVVVTYQATVISTFDTAVTARGNDKLMTNYASLEFSNNPYWDGNGDKPTSETPKDPATVVSLKLTTNKVDASGNAVKGAKFDLYRSTDGTTSNWATTPIYSKVEANTGTDKNIAVFGSLDAGTYKLVESKVPEGYNKMSDLIFKVEIAYDNETDSSGKTVQKIKSITIKDASGKTISSTTIENGTFTADIATGALETNIVNTTGIVLPSTGSAGLAMVYAVAAVMVAGGVVLKLRKREEKDA